MHDNEGNFFHHIFLINLTKQCNLLVHNLSKANTEVTEIITESYISLETQIEPNKFFCFSITFINVPE